MGGFWRNHFSNVLWRSPFPNGIKTKLITASNPAGTITINDLELAAIITGGTLAVQGTNIPYSTILLASASHLMGDKRFHHLRYFTCVPTTTIVNHPPQSSF
jgi:hypothetical protein